jgi:hypothetical protein
MLTPFVKLYNLLVGVFNKIAQAWNNSVGKLSVTIPDWVPEIGGKSISIGTIDEAEEITVDDVIDFSADLVTTVSNLRDGAANDIAAAEQKIADNDITDAFMDGFTTFDIVGIFDGVDFDAYVNGWNDFMNDLDETWNSDDYWNPVDAFNDGYAAGEAVDEGVAGFFDGIGGMLEGLFGGTGSTGSSLDDIMSQVNKGGLSDSFGGGTLGDIANNTGNSADSTSNIEDNLDLAEEELELLRKLAEQEVINRFTTAEIRVDMTNNNNIDSKMDLDGIVTHLSKKLYEELGVVASGVHY